MKHSRWKRFIDSLEFWADLVIIGLVALFLGWIFLTR